MNSKRVGGLACNQVLDHLDSYLDSQLENQAAAEVTAHLESCQDCAQELRYKTELRDRLRTVVRAVLPAPDLHNRIQSSILDTAKPAPPAWIRTGMAIAAALVICASGGAAYQLGYLRLTPASQESYISSISQQVGSIMRVGLGDHVHCAVFRKYPNNPPSLEQMTQTMGPQYSDLITLMKSNVPSGYRVIMAHQCRYHGRKFIHVTASNGGSLLSLVIGRKGDGESFAGANVRPALAASGIPIYQSGVQRFEIAGFETRDHLVYVVSDTGAKRNSAMMTAMASGIRDLLRRIES